ncbi:hypothetical protein ACNI65_18500 [Roseateles sp. So40a]|uniref:hypothetical protein n=1 Tax=Roseateles sp. So40a TaxID=3400226 RepID=UPI003A88CBC6
MKISASAITRRPVCRQIARSNSFTQASAATALLPQAWMAEQVTILTSLICLPPSMNASTTAAFLASGACRARGPLDDSPVAAVPGVDSCPKPDAMRPNDETFQLTWGSCDEGPRQSPARPSRFRGRGPQVRSEGAAPRFVAVGIDVTLLAQATRRLAADFELAPPLPAPTGSPY